MISCSFLYVTLILGPLTKCKALSLSCSTINRKFFDPIMTSSKKVPRRAKNIVPQVKADTPQDIIKYALTTEKAVRCMEKDNTMVFIVERSANKPTIKEAIVKLYGAVVLKVNTLNTMKNTKKAYVKFAEQGEALSIANRIGAI